MNTQPSCQICEIKSCIGIHYGASTCKTCAAAFKRVENMINKTCIHKTCPLKRTRNKRLCMKCVHSKGVALGMDMRKRQAKRIPTRSVPKSVLERHVVELEKQYNEILHSPSTAIHASVIQTGHSMSKRKARIIIQNKGTMENAVWIDIGSTTVAVSMKKFRLKPGELRSVEAKWPINRMEMTVPIRYYVPNSSTNSTRDWTEMDRASTLHIKLH